MHEHRAYPPTHPPYPPATNCESRRIVTTTTSHQHPRTPRKTFVVREAIFASSTSAHILQIHLRFVGNMNGCQTHVLGRLARPNFGLSKQTQPMLRTAIGSNAALHATYHQPKAYYTAKRVTTILLPVKKLRRREHNTHAPRLTRANATAKRNAMYA